MTTRNPFIADKWTLQKLYAKLEGAKHNAEHAPHSKNEYKAHVKRVEKAIEVKRKADKGPIVYWSRELQKYVTIPAED